MIFNMNQSIMVKLFALYSYLNTLLFLFLNIMPFFVRNIVFKIILKRMGKKVLVDYGVFFRYPSGIAIGSNVALNRGCEFYTSFAYKDETIVLEDNVTVGYNTKFYMAQHDYRLLNLPHIAKGIRVCQHAWIGGNVVVLPGVTIGEGAVIGAGSLVSKDIPPYTVAVGVPARVIKKRILKDC